MCLVTTQQLVGAIAKIRINHEEIVNRRKLLQSQSEKQAPFVILKNVQTHLSQVRHFQVLQCILLKCQSMPENMATICISCVYTCAYCSHRIKISNRRATQRCNVSAFFYAKICSLLARRRSSQPVQRVYWPENVIDWLGKWRPTCVMRHARGQKLQSFRRKWPFYMNLYSML